MFAAVAAIAYVANATIVVFVLALLLAYLLEPLVAWIEARLPPGLSSRTSAIAVVYVAAAALAAGAGYAMGPAIAAQWRRLAGASPDVLARLVDRQFLAEHGCCRCPPLPSYASCGSSTKRDGMRRPRSSRAGTSHAQS